MRVRSFYISNTTFVSSTCVHNNLLFCAFSHTVACNVCNIYMNFVSRTPRLVILQIKRLLAKYIENIGFKANYLVQMHKFGFLS